MNKTDWYIVGGTVLALGLIYYFFMYKPKARTTTGTPFLPTNTMGASYSGDISAMSNLSGAAYTGDISAMSNTSGAAATGNDGDISQMGG
jgi:hypothetical protein